MRIIALLLTPVMPGLCGRIRDTILQSNEGLHLDQARWDPAAFRPQGTLQKPKPLVPRIERAE